MLAELTSGSTVIIVSAHPDDAEIGMGGTVAKLTERGINAISVVFTDGRRSPNPAKFSINKLIQTRMEEAKKAADLLHISNVVFLGLENLRDPANMNEASRRFKDILKRYAPSAVFALHPELDRHATHRQTGAIVRQTAPSSLPLWAYEVWGLFPRWDHFEDISNQIEIKIAAIREHQSQISAIPYDAGIRGLNRWRAVFADPSEQQPACSFAEVFLKL